MLANMGITTLNVKKISPFQAGNCGLAVQFLFLNDRNHSIGSNLK